VFGGLAFVRGQRHEAAIAPDAALRKGVARQVGATLVLEPAQQASSVQSSGPCSPSIA